MKSLGYNVGTFSSTVLCKLFEDNIGALTLDQDPATSPRKKLINMKYHHLREKVANYSISVLPIESSKQPEDMLKHSLHEDTFIHHRISIMG